MQYAILPLRYIGISQGVNGSTSHLGLKAIDFGWNSTYLTQSKILLAPFDGKVVWRSGASNTIAFESSEKVKWANGIEDYMTVITCHDNNAPKVGASFKQGEVYGHSGTAGGVALHTHLEVQRGKFQTYTSIKNTSSSGKYSSYIFPNTVLPYEALFVAKDTIYSTVSTIKYNWKEVGEDMELVKFEKEGYDYVWSVDGNAYGENYDITTQGGFSDETLKAKGYERVLKVNGSLFYEYDNKHYACGLEKAFGVNHQDTSMTAVSDYNSCMAVAGKDNDLYFASQEWIINNMLDSAYCAITGLGLVFNGVARDDMHKGFDSQWNQVSGRTIIGEDMNGNILSYSFAGETGKSGLTGKQAQAKALELGFVNAIMFDGGGSVFREVNGTYDISTSRKVKNALMLYRKKKENNDTPSDTTDYKAKYEELETKYKALEETNKALSVKNAELEAELKQSKSQLEVVKNDYETLSSVLKKIKELIQ